MATILDLGALKAFDKVFTFILVTVIIYAFLSKTDYFKNERRVFAAIIALVVGVLTLTSGLVIQTVNLMAPWFVLLVIFAMFMMLAFMMFGFSLDDVKKFIESGNFGVGNWIMWLVVIIGIGSLVYVWDQQAGFGELTQEGNVSAEQAAQAESYGFWQTLFHPKILGMALVMLVAFFTIKFLSEAPKS
jgi:hypothetical protein